MLEDIASEVAKLAGQALSLPMLLLVILALAVVLVLIKRAGGIKLPEPPPVSPDPEDHKSPPIVVRKDGTIPVSNPIDPPEVIP